MPNAMMNMNSLRGYMRQPVGKNPVGQDVTRGYLIYLLTFATGGWLMAAYDFNLQVMSLPKIASGLHLSVTQVGLFGFFVDFALFAFSIFFGFFMDEKSRLVAWVAALAGTTIFTGLTYFVDNYWELCIVRALASGLAYSELSISITLVNESLPAKRRGLYYSLVQSGWPGGVTFAAIIYLVTIQLGWHMLFVFGVAPFAAVVIGRIWIREPERFRRIREIRDAHDKGDAGKVKELTDEYDIPFEDARRHRLKDLFKGEQRRQTIVMFTSFFFYGATSTATNLYIVYWLSHFIGYSDRGAVDLMLCCGSIGMSLYWFSGWLGERISRRKIMFVSAVFMPLFALGFMWLHNLVAAGILYFLLYQAVNGTWSGSAFTYAGESFPTALRGIGVSFSDASMVAGYVFGAAIWTGLIHHVSHLLVWAIIAVVLAFGTWVIWFGKDFDPGKRLK